MLIRRVEMGIAIKLKHVISLEGLLYPFIIESGVGEIGDSHHFIILFILYAGLGKH